MSTQSLGQSFRKLLQSVALQSQHYPEEHYHGRDIVPLIEGVNDSGTEQDVEKMTHWKPSHSPSF